MKQSLMYILIIQAVLILMPHHSPQADPLTLQQALDEALANNPGMKQQRETIRSIETSRWGKLLPDNPEVFTGYEGIPSGSGMKDYGENKIGIAQEFEIPLMYYYRGKINSSEVDAASAEYRLQKLGVAAEVKQAFYRVLMMKEHMAMYREIVELTEDILRTAAIKVDAGEATVYESLRAKVDLAEAENRLMEISAEYTYALYALKQILGRTKEDTLTIAGELTFTPVSIDINSLKAIAMSHHPKLEQALSGVEQRSLEKKLSWLSFVPTVSVSYFRQDVREEKSISAWGSEIGLSIPLWGALKERGRVRSAEHRIQAAGWHVETEKRTVLAAVEKAANSLLVAQDRVRKYRDDMLGEVEELVRIAERSYEEGEMSYLEMNEALRTMQRAKVGYYEALYNFLAAAGDLERAVGTPLDEITK